MHKIRVRTCVSESSKASLEKHADRLCNGHSFAHLCLHRHHLGGGNAHLPKPVRCIHGLRLLCAPQKVQHQSCDGPRTSAGRDAGRQQQPTVHLPTSPHSQHPHCIVHDQLFLRGHPRIQTQPLLLHLLRLFPLQLLCVRLYPVSLLPPEIRRHEFCDPTIGYVASASRVHPRRTDFVDRHTYLHIHTSVVKD